jgi:hypothetical protein
MWADRRHRPGSAHKPGWMRRASAARRLEAARDRYAAGAKTELVKQTLVLLAVTGSVP